MATFRVESLGCKVSHAARLRSLFRELCVRRRSRKLDDVVFVDARGRGRAAALTEEGIRAEAA